MGQFEISETNPNEEVGGGGCLGNGDTKSEDCHGPFVLFYLSATDSNISPHAVLCASCLKEAIEAVEETQESIGEPPIELPPEDVVEVPAEPDAVPDV